MYYGNMPMGSAAAGGAAGGFNWNRINPFAKEMNPDLVNAPGLLGRTAQYRQMFDGLGNLFSGNPEQDPNNPTMKTDGDGSRGGEQPVSPVGTQAPHLAPISDLQNALPFQNEDENYMQNLNQMGLKSAANPGSITPGQDFRQQMLQSGGDNSGLISAAMMAFM